MNRLCIPSESYGLLFWERWWAFALAGWLMASCALAADEPGVTAKTVRIGSIMPLSGDNEIYGLNMKQGIEAALANQIVQGRSLEFVVANDFSDPITTLEVGGELIEKGVFAMLGNVGTLTSLKLMPVLAANQIPAVGFYASGGFDQADIMLNFRPSYAQETAELITAARNAGVKPTGICAFVQNDAYGLAVIEGIKMSLAAAPDAQPIIRKLDQLIEMAMGGINPALNNLGPVGFYRRDTIYLRDGYQSLKNWEQATGESCQLVVLAAIPKVAANFIIYALFKKNPWVFAALSTTAAGDELSRLLSENGVRNKIIITQVVPALDDALPLLADAREKLDSSLNPLNLEGFIVGRMFLAILNAMQGPLTRQNFLKTARQQPFEVGGLKIDFTDGNPGSDQVLLSILNAGQLKRILPEELKALF